MCTFILGAIDDILECDGSQLWLIENFFQPVLRNVKFHIRDVKTGGVYPRTIGTVAADNSIVILGRMPIKEKTTAFFLATRAHLSFTANGKRIERGYEFSYSADLEKNRYMPRLWAKAFMDDLKKI